MTIIIIITTTTTSGTQDDIYIIYDIITSDGLFVLL